MDRTSELRALALAHSERVGAQERQMDRRAASPFLLKANEVFTQIDKFEGILRASYEAFVGLHRFLPPGSSPSSLRPMMAEARSSLAEEVSMFISNSAKSVQDLNHMLEHEEHVSGSGDDQRVQFSKQVVSSLLQKLGRLGVQWERAQKDRKRFDVSPFRLLAAKYAHHVLLTAEDQGPALCAQDLAAVPSSSATPASSVASVASAGLTLFAPKTQASLPCTDAGFAQRFVDEIAPSRKLREYEALASAQKEKLFKEAQSLHKKFSQELVESYHMEHTVHSISGLVTEFSSMIENQSEVVHTVGEVAKDVTASVVLTDEELLKTLERSQRHQFGMILLVLALSVLLLLLHFLSP